MHRAVSMFLYLRRVEHANSFQFRGSWYLSGCRVAEYYVDRGGDIFIRILVGHIAESKRHGTLSRFYRGLGLDLALIGKVQGSERGAQWRKQPSNLKNQHS